MSVLKFNNTNQTVFLKTLKDRVDTQFHHDKVEITGNVTLYFKTFILLSTLLFLYFFLVFFTPDFTFANVTLCVVLGINMAAIGFNVMHDGSHGSYSKNKWINERMANVLNLMGGSPLFWRQKHNVNHHTYTNVEGFDDDIDIRPFIRVHTDQKRYWFHRFQHYYAILLYGLTYLFWIFYGDLRKYFTGKIADNTPINKMSFSDNVNFWGAKIIHIVIYLVIPSYKIGIIETLIGYLIISFSCGLVIAIVFQLAHVVEEAQFVAPVNVGGNIEAEWAIHQINTTVNFATHNKFLSWFIGGLNFQVEHHLFPKISHVHYPRISSIVKKTCEEFNLMYKEFPTIVAALVSHFRHLKTMGVA